jgi:general secretion pathway protein B
MSFILEALIQAQLERQFHGVPSLYTVQSLPQLRPRPRRHWPLVGTGIAALSGLLAIALLQPWHREDPEGSAPIIASASVVARDPQARPSVVTMATLDVASAAPVQQLRQETALTRLSVGKPGEPKHKHHRKVSKGEITMPATKAAAAPGIRIYSISELPAELQKVARGISIAGFAHSDNPKERTAIINDRALREGEEVSGGLRVERIASDGVIFNLKGYRFRKGRS